MVTVLKKGTSQKKFEELLKRLVQDTTNEGVNIRKYAGKLHLKKDPLEIQKEMRSEWE